MTSTFLFRTLILFLGFLSTQSLFNPVNAQITDCNTLEALPQLQVITPEVCGGTLTYKAVSTNNKMLYYRWDYSNSSGFGSVLDYGSNNQGATSSTFTMPGITLDNQGAQVNLLVWDYCHSQGGDAPSRYCKVIYHPIQFPQEKIVTSYSSCKPVNLTAGSYTNLSWYDSNYNLISNANTLTVNPTVTTTYYVDGVNSCNQFLNKSPITVNVPSGIYMVGYHNACNQSTTRSNFTLSYMTSWSNVTWSISPSGAGAPVLPFQQNGPYGAALVDFNDGFIGTATLYVKDNTTGCTSPGFPVNVTSGTCPPHRIGNDDVASDGTDLSTVDLELYPCPSNAGFKFKGLNFLGENVTLEITSANGTSMLKENVVLNSTTTYGEGFPAGVYTVTVVSDNNRKVLKYIGY